MVFAHICCICHKTIKLPYKQDGMFVCNWCLEKLCRALGIKVEIIKLAIHKIQDGLTLLADACKMEKGTTNEVSCFFKISEDNGMHFDDIVMRKTEKLCRRKSPRLEVNGLTIDTRLKR